MPDGNAPDGLAPDGLAPEGLAREAAPDGAAVSRKGPVDKRLIKELPGLRSGLAASVVAGLFATAAVVVQAVALAHLLAGAMPGAHPGDRAHWFVLLATGVVGRALAALGGEVVAGRTAERAKAQLRARLVSAALRQAPEGGPRGARGGGAGEIATLAGKGLDALDVYIGRCLPDLVLAVAAPVALLVAVGVLDWLSALVLVVVVALFPLFGGLVGRASMPLAAERWKRVERLGSQVADLFQGLPVLRAFGCTAAQRETIVKANEALCRSSFKVLRVAFLTALVLDTLGSVSVALVAVPLGLRLLTGSVQLSAALAVLVMAPEVVLPLRRASAEFHESTEGLAAAQRALELVGRSTPASSAHASSAHASSARASVVLSSAPVQLRCVTVELPGRQKPVLAGASLVISPGETVALVGRSGAGKSTVMSLLLGFLTPTMGSVTVGDQDLSGLDLDKWRSQISYLPEHPTLLAAALADNLRLANATATDAELLAALAAAGAGDLVASLPRGLATPLGEGGRPVSAGERQRIALARVLLRPRPLYLLDEPTVHLDDQSEVTVLGTLRHVLAGQSALVVSHRPALLALADRVLALQEGNLVPIDAGDWARAGDWACAGDGAGAGDWACAGDEAGAGHWAEVPV
jgi:thiol reductant ABC exporter CydD subunit